MKIVITGKNGMLATDFIKIFNNKYEIFWYEREEMDISYIDQVEKILKKIKPKIVLNFAAYTDVEWAESNEWLQENYKINTYAVVNLAKITKKLWIDFLTVSTDYVFDGENESGYNENDLPYPINNYWRAKLLWEQRAKIENENTIIVRTSWLFGGENHKNFVNTMLKLSSEKKKISVVNDQFGLPTFTEDLSRAIDCILLNLKESRGKVFHFSNSSEYPISWYDFAKEIFRISNKNILVSPCKTGEFPMKALRPKNSFLKNNSYIQLPSYIDALERFLKNR